MPLPLDVEHADDDVVDGEVEHERKREGALSRAYPLPSRLVGGSGSMRRVLERKTGGDPMPRAEGLLGVDTLGGLVSESFDRARETQLVGECERRWPGEDLVEFGVDLLLVM